jgi:transforming growth factor-beta-induced protein
MLLHHVISAKISSSEITTGKTATTLNGEDVIFKINMNKKLLVNKVKIINADTEADNGIVHTLQGVLLPAWVDKNIVDVVGGTSDLSAINDFIAQANLVETLSGKGPFTVFAPTNSGIEKNLAVLSNAGIDDNEVITAFLNYHIVPGIYPASSLIDGLSLTTVMGDILVFNLMGETATVNGNKISSTDVLANNGMIHSIDGVLLPPSVFGPQVEPIVPDVGSATQASCSLCGGQGNFSFKTPDAMVTLPEGILNDAKELSCTLLEQNCQFGFCSAEDCAAIAASDANEKCGCVPR